MLEILQPFPIPSLLHLPLTPFYQGPPEDELPWVLQHRLTQLRTASGCQVVGSAICASRVKLQHLPSQVRGGEGTEEGGGGGRSRPWTYAWETLFCPLTPLTGAVGPAPGPVPDFPGHFL